MADYWDASDFVALIQAISAAMTAAQDDLNALDSALGDGDHGGALATAFADAAQKVLSLENPTPASILQATSQSLLNRMGGASGALYGTLFLRLSLAFKSLEKISLADWQTALQAGLEGVQARGKSAPGDKTLVDALAPAVAAFQTAETLERALELAAVAAHDGAAKTATMIAKFGRAKFVGERAIGHVDAGAQSMAVLFEALKAFWENKQHGKT
jgi:dihydroxyacetone kinase-like protein